MFQAIKRLFRRTATARGGEIPPDKAKEYMEVAALTCLDIDTLFEISQDTDMTADDLRAQIKLIHENKESATTNKKEREERYQACSLVFSLAAAGMVRSTRIG